MLLALECSGCLQVVYTYEHMSKRSGLFRDRSFCDRIDRLGPRNLGNTTRLVVGRLTIALPLHKRVVPVLPCVRWAIKAISHRCRCSQTDKRVTAMGFQNKQGVFEITPIVRRYMLCVVNAGCGEGESIRFLAPRPSQPSLLLPSVPPSIPSFVVTKK